MASVAQNILIDTETGQRGEKGKKSCSFNQRQENFTIFAKLKGKPSKAVKLKFQTSPNGKDWKDITDTKLEFEEELFFHDMKENMLAHFRVIYDESALVKGKDKEKVADLHVAVCFRDAR